MTDIHQTTLRELARQYAQGSIGPEAYRQSRAELLHGILSGKIPLQVNNYPPLLSAHSGEDETPQDGITIEDKKKIEPVTNNKASASPNSRASHLPASIAALLVTLAMIGLGLIFLDDNSAPRPATNNTNPIPIDKVDDEIIQAKEAILGFLDNNNWDEIEQELFLDEWSSLPQENLGELRQSTEFSRLTNALYKRLLEEQTLSRLGDTDSAIKQRNLLNFAEQVGIDDARIKMKQEHQSVGTTPHTQ